MKFHIQKHLESFLVKERVPTEYKKLAMSCESQLEDTCTLITFPHDRKNMVKSALVHKALTKLGELEDQSLVVIGGCFTSESVELLNEVDAVILSLSEGHWTDTSRGHIRADHD
ncbi:hypothetical protein [Paraglaciecola polaris]|uniref:Uncharacterized protein n=1 Tax=Paraglaciecola polaris LMG 21857 TaxID=1129793 RepID=K6ZMT7_9ALTE|nr:hypothetical protein [Paraglaciecola polaris]GAC31632.1 hypothetical protein GPLA_0716 [Paraglaciecola polaris LMG 21857]|tara:strand:+ start:51 stop:392 length:342 start_codon:yes stop_codon:yes gene_type:complete